MPYRKTYDATMVRGIYQTQENSGNVRRGANPPAAHAVMQHVGKTMQDLENRYTGGGTSLASSWHDFETMIQATVAILNSAGGQTCLGRLDTKLEKQPNRAPFSTTIEADIGARLFRASCYGEVGRDILDMPIGCIISDGFAAKGKIVCHTWVNGLLWIQTCFPSQVDERDASQRPSQVVVPAAIQAPPPAPMPAQAAPNPGRLAIPPAFQNPQPVRFASTNAAPPGRINIPPIFGQ